MKSGKLAFSVVVALLLSTGVSADTQDTVVCADLLGKPASMHKYAIPIPVADARDGACSSSTLKEASSWGKVETTFEQMVYAEASTVIPLLVSDAYHRGFWKNRTRRSLAKIF